jgi:glycosyltransferase involved in cell wall biosynthesis
MHFKIVAPTYNEGNVAIQFIELLQQSLAKSSHSFELILVNDCSNDNTIELLNSFQKSTPNFTWRIHHLVQNKGHQGAIYEGLQLAFKENCDGLIVMDSDGEDDPAAILKIVESNLVEDDIVFVKRGKRHDGLGFKAYYNVYQLFLFIVLGHTIRFGNFSFINKRVFAKLEGQPFFNFAGFLSRQKMRKGFVTQSRLPRLGGERKMTRDGLILHGLYLIMEHSDRVLLFYVKLIIFMMLVFFGAVANVLIQKFILHTAIQGWTSLTLLISGGFSILAVCLLLTCILLIYNTKLISSHLRK